MKNLKIAMVMMASVAVAGSALAQSKMDSMHKMSGMHKGSMQGHMKMKSMSAHDKMVVDCMMTGLSKDEKMTAHEHMMKMSKSEMAVMMKRGSLCMKDNHKYLVGKEPSDKLMHEHMMSGLSKSEKMTMMGMMKKMSPKEMAVGKKMVTNCCNYGMKHAK